MKKNLVPWLTLITWVSIAGLCSSCAGVGGPLNELEEAVATPGPNVSVKLACGLDDWVVCSLPPQTTPWIVEHRLAILSNGGTEPAKAEVIITVGNGACAADRCNIAVESWDLGFISFDVGKSAYIDLNPYCGDSCTMVSVKAVVVGDTDPLDNTATEDNGASYCGTCARGSGELPATDFKHCVVAGRECTCPCAP